MRCFHISLIALLFLAASTFLLDSCAAPPPPRQLLSITISPTVGAPGTGSSQVQFVATGHYNTAPYIVTPLDADWGAAGYPQKIAAVTQNGLATCAQGASGSTDVEAWVMLTTNPMCNSIDSAGRPGCNNIGASAQLTCP